MTIRKPVVLIDGQLSELPNGDSILAPITVTADRVGINQPFPQHSLDIGGTLGLTTENILSDISFGEANCIFNAEFYGITATLPPIALGIIGRTYGLKNSSTGTVTLAAFSDNLIDGAASILLNPQEAILVTCINYKWCTIVKPVAPSSYIPIVADGTTNGILAVGTQYIPQGNKIFTGGGTTASTNSLEVHNLTGISNSLVVQDSGYVGIGTYSPKSQLDSIGSLGLAYSSNSTTTTLNGTNCIVVYNGVTAATYSLPTAVGIKGRIYIIKNKGTNILTIQCNGSELLDGKNTLTLLPGGVIHIISSGGIWDSIFIQESYFDLADHALTPNTFMVTATPTSTNTGVILQSLTPSATSVTPALTNAANRLFRMRTTSSSAAGQICHHYNGNSFSLTVHTTGTGGGMYIDHSFTIDDSPTVAGARHFAGVSASVAVPANIEPNLILNSIGIVQLSTDATQLYIQYGNATTVVTVPLGATNFPISTANAYRLQILSQNNKTYILATNMGNGTQVMVSPSNSALPLPSVMLAWRAWRSNNATALSVAWSLNRVVQKGFITP